jgi:hypothetical protein
MIVGLQTNPIERGMVAFAEVLLVSLNTCHERRLFSTDKGACPCESLIQMKTLYS